MKTIIITGASRGIGYQTALKLANDGHHIIAIARSKTKLEQLKAAVSGGTVTILALDLTQVDSFSQIKKVLTHIDHIDGLINNAGLVLNKSFLETSLQEWQHLFDVNLFSVVELIKIIHPKLQKGAHIVNIGSMGGFQGSAKFPGLSTYSTAKGALTILTEALSTEFTNDQIAVNCLCLGAVQTEMLAEAFPGYQAPVQANEMGTYIADFVLNGHRFYNGKILPIALNNPE